MAGETDIARTSSRQAKRWFYAILVVGAILELIPLYYMVITSFKPKAEVMAFPPKFYAVHPTLLNYTELFSMISFGRYFMNSLVVACFVTIGQLFFCSLAAYAFAKRKFPGRDFIFGAFLASLMVPSQVTLVPGFILYKYLGWIDSLKALTIPGLWGVFGTFMMRQFMLTIPDDLLDAARIDGCGEFGIFMRVVMPLSGPGLATLGIMTFMGSWNSFTWPLIVIQSNERRTLPLVLAVLNGQYGWYFGRLMAASVIATAPLVVIFLLFQKQVIKGIALTGIKG
ncbi:MAG: carbohydrate ABC transporter permease [Clostridia bacterium]|nr:carbohydrate ABC transporter permease [Clostridia bacterium]